MTPTPWQRTGLASAWSKTHSRVVGGQRPADPPGEAETAEAPAEPVAPNGRTWKYLSTRLPADVHKTLRRLSVEKDVSLQEMVGRGVARLRPRAERELTDAAVSTPKLTQGAVIAILVAATGAAPTSLPQAPGPERGARGT